MDSRELMFRIHSEPPGALGRKQATRAGASRKACFIQPFSGSLHTHTILSNRCGPPRCLATGSLRGNVTQVYQQRGFLTLSFKPPLTNPTWILSWMLRKCHLSALPLQVGEASCHVPFSSHHSPLHGAPGPLILSLTLLCLKHSLKQISFIAKPTAYSAMKHPCPGKCPVCRSSACEVWQTG